MADVRVDYERLGELETQLTTALGVIGNEFESMITLSGAVGDGDLGARLIVFGNSWNKHRFDIRDRLEWLRDSVKNIHEKMAEVDTTLAAGITAPAAPVATNAPGGGQGTGGKKAI